MLTMEELIEDNRRHREALMTTAMWEGAMEEIRELKDINARLAADLKKITVAHPPVN